MTQGHSPHPPMAPGSRCAVPGGGPHGRGHLGVRLRAAGRTGAVGGLGSPGKPWENGENGESSKSQIQNTTDWNVFYVQYHEKKGTQF